ncbi:MAG: elongation factor P [Planctomycetota bacterium]|nr:elongation factor P [Planctomycetota bacterium]MDP6988820.1 elongation factor P [Planctomycetota bacterium]
MIESNQFKRGVCIQFKGAPMVITAVTFSTPTARGGNTIAKTRLKNLISGQLLNESIRGGEKFEEVELEQHPCSFMYSDGTTWHFIDDETFEQFGFDAGDLGDDRLYLLDGVEGLRAMLIDGQVVSITLPLSVDLRVVECDPAIKGATAQAQLKGAVCETGLKVQVPPYLEVGEKIRVDTRDGHFIERVKS